MGTGTQLNDKFETIAIKEVFGERAYNIPITSTKPLTGHMMGATGAVEAIFGIERSRRGSSRRRSIFKRPIRTAIWITCPTWRERRVDIFMGNAFGFGGHNAVLVLKRFTD